MNHIKSALTLIKIFIQQNKLTPKNIYTFYLISKLAVVLLQGRS